MPVQKLGNSGLIVSRLSFGSWVTFHNQLDSNAGYELMKRAFKAGINFFDNAEVYAKGESERVMGVSVRQGIEDGVWKREDLVISTKLFFGTRDGYNNKGNSRKHIIEGIRASLERMGLQYVDLLFCHRPDPLTPLEETVRAMNWVIDQGLCFYWGTSEWSAADIASACRIADKLGLIRPCFEQPQYHLLERQRVEIDYVSLYQEFGLGLTTWSPLASGVLTGKYSGKVLPEGSRLTLPAYKFLLDSKFGDDSWQIDVADSLKPIAQELGCTLAQLAIAWCLTNPMVSTVILGATSIAQLEENLLALKVLPLLTRQILEKIDTACGSRALPKFTKGEEFSRATRAVSKMSNFDLDMHRSAL